MSITTDRIEEQGFIHPLMDDACAEIKQLELVIDELQSKLEEMENQEPVAYMPRQIFDSNAHTTGAYISFIDRKMPGQTPLYTRPVPAIPKGWRQIETAPRDGTRILGWSEGQNDADVMWFDDKKTEWTSALCQDFGGYETPTHWMPLPAVPEKECAK